MLDPNHSVLAVHMGESFDKLSPLLKKAHHGRNKLSGTANVVQGNAAARLICRAFHFPNPGTDVNLTVNCDHSSDSMNWKRNFNGLQMESNFRRQGDYLVEYLGPLALSFKAVENNGELHYQFIKTKLLGLPIPNFLSPQVAAGEREQDGRYCFTVEVTMFLVGMVIAYAGELTVESV